MQPGTWPCHVAHPMIQFDVEPAATQIVLGHGAQHCEIEAEALDVCRGSRLPLPCLLSCSMVASRLRTAVSRASWCSPVGGCFSSQELREGLDRQQRCCRFGMPLRIMLGEVVVHVLSPRQFGRTIVDDRQPALVGAGLVPRLAFAIVHDPHTPAAVVRDQARTSASASAVSVFIFTSIVLLRVAAR